MTTDRAFILIVEDESIIARDIQRQLQSLGFGESAIVDTGEEAIARAGELRPQLVLMDIHLAREMDGIDAAIAIRAQFGIPTVFITAYATKDVVDRAKLAEPLGYIIKPFDDLSLRTTVEIALHKSDLDRKLRRSEARYRAVVQSAHDAIITADRRGDIVGWSPAAEMTFGYGDAEILGLPLTMLVPEHLFDKHVAGMRRAGSGDAPRARGRVLELEGRHKNGTLFPIEMTLARWEVDDEWFATAVIRNISDRKRAEGARALQIAALNAAANAIVITDIDGTIEWVNPAFTTISGYSPEDAIGRNPRDLLRSGKHDRAFYEEMWRTLLTGHVWQGEIVNRRKDGSCYTEEQTITPVKMASGTITHFIGVKRDVTEHRRLRDELLQAQKMEVVGQLAGGIAHDFNNLLTVINGTASLALMELAADNPARPDFALIKQTGDRAAQLTKQLLAVGRRELIAPTVVDVKSLVTRTAELLRRAIGESIALDIDAREEARCVVDAGQIEQVILNLAVNARDAMPDGGVLTIEVRHVALDEAFAAAHPGVSPGPHVMLAVTDSGIGMTTEIRQRVFEPFFTTKGQGQGTGLGLATVYGIVIRSGGVIEVESEPGRGSSFRIFLPLAASSSVIAREPVAESIVARGTETILLVEDEEAPRRLAARVLRSAGYTVMTAGSGHEALAMIDTHAAPLHLMLTDVVMPGMSGRELAARFATRRPDVPVLFVSGHADDEVFRRGVSKDPNCFIAKPYSALELTWKVRQVLDATADASLGRSIESQG